MVEMLGEDMVDNNKDHRLNSNNHTNHTRRRIRIAVKMLRPWRWMVGTLVLKIRDRYKLIEHRRTGEVLLAQTMAEEEAVVVEEGSHRIGTRYNDN